MEASFVVKGLYLGSEINGRDKKWKNKVNACLFLKDDADQDLSQFLEPISKQIDEVLEAKGTILIHCKYGRSRSASIVWYWLTTRRFRNNSAAAFAFLKKQRSIVSPNMSFVNQVQMLTDGIPKRGKENRVNECNKTAGK